MNEVDKTFKKFKDIARRQGAKYLALTEGGGLFLLKAKPSDSAYLACVKADSERAADLVRRAIEEFGMHYLSPTERAGR